MYDIHCHIIPDVDDGSGSLNDSIEMAKLASKSGTKGIIATPHCNMTGLFENYWSSDFEEKIKELNTAFVSRGIPVTVYPGQEIYLSSDISSLLKKGELITLNRSRYVLVEFDFGETEAVAYNRIGTLASEGYVPIVAHPERYAFVAENPDAANKIRSLGALLQLNCGSVKGRFGIYPMLASKKILRNGLADFVASDAHSQYSRTPDLTEAHEIICESFSYEYADILFEKNPLKVINNEEIW